MAVESNSRYLDRVVDSEVAMALTSAPAVLIEGPRGCGKTWTGRRFARSEVVLDESEAMRLAAEVDPASILEGPEPRLLDEWQLVRSIWNPMRHACDRRGGFGHFVLTGSQNPPDDITEHSGAGRVARVRMRPMSLWESGDSTGEVSLASLMAGGRCRAAETELTIADVADLICRGGWPRMISMAPAVAQARLRDYLDDIARVDISRVAGVRRDPGLAGRLLASLARNEATAASHATLRADLTEQDAGPPRPLDAAGLSRRIGPPVRNRAPAGVVSAPAVADPAAQDPQALLRRPGAGGGRAGRVGSVAPQRPGSHGPAVRVDGDTGSSGVRPVHRRAGLLLRRRHQPRGRRHP